MAIRGIELHFGKKPANTALRGCAMVNRKASTQDVRAAEDNFTSDQHPDLVMANPPFNISEWWDAKLEGDARWRYGTPPGGNANFAWIQHMLHTSPRTAAWRFVAIVVKCNVRVSPRTHPVPLPAIY